MVVRSRTVDSRPIAVGPLSMIRSIRPSRSARTCSARVGDSRFDRLALGAEIGRPKRSIRPRATLPAGTRTATVSLPAVTRSGMLAARFRTKCQRAGPEPLSQRLRRDGPFGDAVPRLCDRRHVDDQWVDGRPALGREDPRDALDIGGNPAQSVHGLGGESHQSAPQPGLDRRVEHGRVGLVGVRGQGREWRSDDGTSRADLLTWEHYFVGRPLASVTHSPVTASDAVCLSLASYWVRSTS